MQPRFKHPHVSPGQARGDVEDKIDPHDPEGRTPLPLNAKPAKASA